MNKILFVIENLGAGGAERVLVNLVNHMDPERFQVTVLTLFEKGVNADSLRDGVRLINLGKRRFRGMKTLFKFLPKQLLYNRYLAPYAEDYDLLVAYMTGVPTFIVAGAPLSKIAWLHGEFFPGCRLIGLTRIYDRYDAVAGVSRYVCDTFDRLIHSKRKPVVIYNTNDTDKIRSLAAEPFQTDPSVVNLVSVGCLEQTKGFDRLLRICARLKEDGFRFSLRILGEGIERQALERQIVGSGLEDSVVLMGYCQNPYCIVSRSDLFICSSRTEGLSTAVSEALVLGIPVVSTDVSGARELLGQNDEFGIVTENDENSLYVGVKRILADDALRQRYRKSAKARAQFFDPANTVRQAEQLLESI